MTEQMNIISVDLTPTAELWVGAKGGRHALASLEPTFEHLPDVPAVLALDFAPVQVLTASAVRTGVLPLLTNVLKRGHRAVLANLDEPAMDEVQLAAEASKTAVVCA